MTRNGSEFHYVIAIRSKQLNLHALDKWAVMHVGRNFDDANHRYKLAQEFLKPMRGEMVVFKIDAADISRIWVVGLVGTRRSPKLEDVRNASDEVRKTFWRRAGMETSYLDIFAQPAVVQEPERGGWLNRFMPS